MNGVTWACHVCGDERPDARINVFKHERNVEDVEFTEHVRYCNDRATCAEGARTSYFVPLED